MNGCFLLHLDSHADYLLSLPSVLRAVNEALHLVYSKRLSPRSLRDLETRRPKAMAQRWCYFGVRVSKSRRDHWTRPLTGLATIAMPCSLA